jgi:hypothetical protein
VSVDRDLPQVSESRRITDRIGRLKVSEMTVGWAAHLTVCPDTGSGAHGGDACRLTTVEEHVRMPRTNGVTRVVWRPVP